MIEHPPLNVLAGGGEMGALMRSIDWSRTAVGPIERWPQSLRTALSILLETGFPMYIAWGPEFTQFYNDGYRPILGSTKHPAAMGISTRQTFAEIWDIIGPMFEGVMRGTAVNVTDFMLPLDRHGFVEECYFIFSYSPIREETGDVGGVLVTVTETTERVLGARRLETLRLLSARTQNAATAAAACALAAEVLSDNAADLPFALLYLLDEGGARARLAGASRIEPGGTLSLVTIDLADPAAPWPLAAASGFTGVSVVDIPAAGTAQHAASGAPARAAAIPIVTPGAERPSGVLIAALSPRLAFDHAYSSFLDLVAGHIGTAIASARALEEAQARAEALAELDRAKTTFFSNVSHEFRTPLTLMLGPAEDALAAEDRLSAPERERWALVHRNALRLSKLVNALLDFARFEAGRINVSYEPTDLAALTGEFASMFRSAVERAGLRFRVELEPIEEPVFIDHDMWEKIVLNLLSNALKFTFDGEIALTLRSAGDQVELAVADTGVGISPDQLPHVFTRFHRVKDARARTHEGTGIGLALVGELARLHGGRVGVESVERQGTTFRVTLPKGRAHLPADRIGAARTLPSTATGAAPYVEEAMRWLVEAPDAGAAAPAAVREPAIAAEPRARIVFADDNADMREYVTRLLTERWEVDAFPHGAAALDAIRRSPPDLVLADVMMPVLDGFALLGAVKQDPALSFVPVVLLSARAGEEATAEGLKAGADDYIVKPFSARELQLRLASQIAKARSAREAKAIEADAKRRLYAHFMQAPFPIAVLSGAELIVELANPITLQAWGRDERMVGQPLLKGLPELEGQPFVDYLNEVFRTGVAYEGKAERALLARGPGGALEEVYFDYVYAPVRAQDGTVDAILIAGFEVTAQVQAQQQMSSLLGKIEASERHFRELVENLPELAWTAQPDGHIDYYNRRWYEYTGTTFEQMEGWGWQSVHDPAMLEAVLERWKRSIATGEPFEMEFPLRGADGSYRWFLTRVRPFRDSSGRIVRWFGTNTDIDERRRNDDFRETFLGVLGHDLRNPLNTILTTSRLLAAREQQPEDRKRLERMMSSGVRMQRMIEQLLDLTRARLAGGIPVRLSERPLELAPIVSKIVEETRAAHPGVPIELRVEGLAAARADADRFEQVVSNLLGNAVAHGDPAVPVRVSLGDRDGDVSVAVWNGGPPIDPAFLPLLFNPFAGAGKPQGRSAGLGLGLYISERIVVAHGGRLLVRSTAKDGTTFEVILPGPGRNPSRRAAGRA